jgi:hypothetical protein
MNFLIYEENFVLFFISERLEISKRMVGKIEGRLGNVEERWEM